MRGWNQLGVVETIYEDESEFFSTSSPSVSPSVSSSPSVPLHSRVEAWSLKTGHETDVLIRVQGTCFRLHKDPLVSRSLFLKRQLMETSNFTLSPPLSITPETFAAVAGFCYGCRIRITATNVAALRTTAELLGMTEAGVHDEENLRNLAETYFRRVVSVDQEYTYMVLRSCLPLLPESETTACLVSRCVEAMVSGDDGDNLGDTCFHEVVTVHPQDFQTVAQSMNKRFRNHDILYKMVDLYLKENKFGKLTEDQKTQICNSIDCTKLSTGTLVDCVQNPTMPLRLVVQAVLVEHLNTRLSIASTLANGIGGHPVQSSRSKEPQRRGSGERTSLGEILYRDAALRQTARLRAVMESTNSRIQSLEKELSGLNKILLDRQAEEEEGQQMNVLGSERSASFHFVPAENGKIERGERGSVSSSSFRFDARMEKYEGGRSSFSAGAGSCGRGSGATKMTKTFRQRFITGLRNAFRVPNSASH